MENKDRFKIHGEYHASERKYKMYINTDDSKELQQFMAWLLDDRPYFIVPGVKHWSTSHIRRQGKFTKTIRWLDIEIKYDKIENDSIRYFIYYRGDLITTLDKKYNHIAEDYELPNPKPSDTEPEDKTEEGS